MKFTPKSTNDLVTINLEKNDAKKIAEMASVLALKYCTVEDSRFANTIDELCLEMPLNVLKSIRKLQSENGPAAILVKGMSIDMALLPPTPQSWDVPWTFPAIAELEAIQCLFAGSLGHIFGWHTQENGRFLRHILPIAADADEQLGSSSRVELLWHNEEAFHPARADYIAIMCYRNSEMAGTTFASARSLVLADPIVEVLRSPCFMILPDDSHRPTFNASNQWSLSSHDFARIDEMLTKPNLVPVLTGDRESPFIRIDPAFMSGSNEEAAAALESIKNEINENLVDIILEPGDILLIDNLRAVHGRRSYRPYYGPSQRWMRRVNIASDLRKAGTNLTSGSRRRFI